MLFPIWKNMVIAYMSLEFKVKARYKVIRLDIQSKGGNKLF